MMATYFNGGSEIQADNLQTLYLMNRGGGGGGGGGYAAYSVDAGQSYSSQSQHHALAQGSVHHAPSLLSHPHLVGIPLTGPTSPNGDDPSRGGSSIHHEISGHHQLVPRFHYNLWGAVGEPSPSGGGGQIPTAVAVSSTELGYRPHPGQGGLSLSLNNSSPHNNNNNNNNNNNVSILSPGNNGPTTSGSGSPGVILGSKYLKAAQELLDEAVNVGKAIHVADGSKDKAKAASAVGAPGEGSSVGGGGVESGGGGGVASAELTTAQRQELQMKKAKLLSMLDEVEQRYRQYQRQMQGVAAALEQAAGLGSARSYTALALQTISRQFRCLKDAIGAQIKVAGRSLGEELEDEKLGSGSGASRSRLRMVDNQLRQQRALQQLGMMHHNAWRPQRGLPERAVSVLRAWLFEHFLHPYPKDSDKHMLAKQTGLTRSQVSNWFINARVRLWKPMVEEMYLEETKSQEQQNPSGSDVHPTTTATTTTATTTATATTPRSTSTTLHFNQNPHPIPTVNDLSNPSLLSPNNSSSTGPTANLHSAIGPLQGFSLVGSSESDPKRQRLFPSDVIHNLNSSSPSSILTSSMDQHNNNNKADIKDFGGFGYPIGDIGSRFNPDPPHHQHQLQYHHGNTVSLTLGLPHCDQNLTLAGTHHQNFQPELCGIDTTQPPPHSSAAYDVGGIGEVQNRTSWRSTLI